MTNELPTILLVDDAPEYLFLLKKILCGMGRIITAESGADALVMALEEHPKLILLDVVMPVMDGYETCARLKEDSRTRDIPILFVTGAGRDEDEVRGFLAGGLDYIVKPFVFEVVKARVRNHLILKVQQELLREENAARRRAEEALMEANLGLEQQVRERTGWLVASIQKLEREFFERREAMKRLARSEAQLKQLVETIPGILYRWSPNEGNRYYSPGLERILGLSASDLDGGEAHFTGRIHADETGLYGEGWNKAFSEGKHFDLKYRIRHADGSWRWLHDRTIGVHPGEDGGIIVEGLAFDITEARRLEEEGRMRQRQMLQADKMISLGILVSGVAHEINNPNHVIMANLGVLSRAWQEVQPILDRYSEENGGFLVAGREYATFREQLGAMFGQVLGSSERIRNIVEELKNFARERPVQINTSVCLNSVVRSALTLLDNMLKKSGATVALRFAPDLPRVVGDYQRLEQVVINLIQNACQAMERSPGSLSISTMRDAKSDSVVFQVKDEGVGIPEENLGIITDPFFTTKRDVGGTGLGLSISSGIIADHGGTMEFQSEPDKGTTVTVTIPVAREGAFPMAERRGSARDRRRRTL